MQSTTSKRVRPTPERRFRASAVLLFLGCVTFFGNTRVASAIDIGTSSAFQDQEFESWGTSLAWFGNSLGIWSNDAAHTEVMDLLFDGPNGLGFNYARYNIGGGQNPSLIGNFRPGAAVPGWVPSAPSSVTDSNTWNWNWNADIGQRKTLNSAISRGVHRVDSVSYSAPYWMTNSLDSAGAVGGGDNLPLANVNALAHYQTEVVKHFNDNLGIQFGTHNPINEADATWWQAGGQQEGMHVSTGTNQNAVYTEVGQMLASKGLGTGLAVGDEFNAASTVSAYNQYNSTTRSLIKQINTHAYGGNSTSSLQQLRNIAATEGVPLYNSEYGNNATTGLQGGIGVANRITADINTMGVNGWTFWQAVEPLSLSGAGWGLLWADYGINGSSYVVRKQYHVMRQFSSHIRPGARILNNSDIETVAAYNPGQDSTVLVFTNDETTADTNVYDLIDQTPTFTRVIRTDAAGNYVSLGPGNVVGSQITVNSPGNAVTTVVAHHRPNLIQNATFAGSGSWQTSGNVSFNASVDNTQDGSGGMVLASHIPGNSGSLRQEGIGHALRDITGKAYEFSVDAALENEVGQYGADAHIALEFYGADGQTLTHSSVLDFAESLKSNVEDANYRVFRTATVQAPAGSRYVRPVVRFGTVVPGSTGQIELDNAYLQETRFVPRARAWQGGSDGAWSQSARWQDDAATTYNSNAYFGPENSVKRTITVDSNVNVNELTLDSEAGYQFEGSGTLTLGDGSTPAKVDTRSGTHTITASTSLAGDTEFQAVDGAKLVIDGSLALNGSTLTKTGSGQLQLADGFDMGAGTLAVEASLTPSVSIGENATLDGTLEVNLAAGQQAHWGSVYTVARFTSPGQDFNSVDLPELGEETLAWEFHPSSRDVIVEVVNLVDFKRDSRIDGQDRDQWLADYGFGTGSDADQDGVASGSDFLTWQRKVDSTSQSNTLELVVDPTTGDAEIRNTTGLDFVIDSYSISSESGSLLTSWNSLDDQGVIDWIEAFPSPGRVSELNPTGDLLLADGSTMSLAGLFDTVGGTQDLQFQFRETALGTVTGRVVYVELAVPSSLASVPEPSTLALLVAGSIASFFARRRTSGGAS